MEMNTQKRMASLKEKIPDIQKTLDTVRFLKLKNVCFTALLLGLYQRLTLRRILGNHWTPLMSSVTPCMPKPQSHPRMKFIYGSE